MRRLSLVLVVSFAAWPCPARAEASSEPRSAVSEERLEWRWRRPGVWEYAASGAVGAGALAVQFLATPPLEPQWVSPVWFDSSVRNALRSKSADTREVSSLISDYTGMGTQVWAYFDTTVIPLATDRGNFDVAWQTTFINLQASALTMLATRGIDRLAVRQRPDVEPCESDPNYHDMCFQGSTSSFPSGHTSFAFVGAGLVCAHHLNLPLYASPIADGAACAVAASAAVATGVLRLVADRHYATDVLAGAAIGAGAGFVMPVFAHYWFVESSEPTAAVQGFTWLPIVSSKSFQLAVAGRL